MVVYTVYTVPTSIHTLDCPESPVTRSAYTVTPQPVDNSVACGYPVDNFLGDGGGGQRRRIVTVPAQIQKRVKIDYNRLLKQGCL